MHQRFRTWGLFALRWGIAIAGIWWVVANMTWRDRVLVLNDNNLPVEAVVIETDGQEERAKWFRIIEPVTGQQRVVTREQVVNRAERGAAVLLRLPDGGVKNVPVLALELSDDLRRPRVQRFLIPDAYTGGGRWITPAETAGGFQLKVPHPRLEVGVLSMVRNAEPVLLWAAVLIYPVTYLLTSYRWHALLRAMGIRISRLRAFVLNMVGAFYNTFMPGSTGGDVLKAYYASRQTEHKHRAVISVVVDRVIGLLTLIILGGVMAGWQSLRMGSSSDPAATACRQVAAGSAVILAGTALVLFLFGHRGVRHGLGLGRLIEKLPMQRHVHHAVDAARIYRSRPGLMMWSILVTFPVHITVVFSAFLAGEAFGLPIPPGYYFVCVPVIVLAGAVPISLQGAGVMEFFAIQLTKQYGTTVSQAFALTMSVRLAQMLWNLVGGIFVLRGGYHAPSEAEQEALEVDDEEAQPEVNSDVRATI